MRNLGMKLIFFSGLFTSIAYGNDQTCSAHHGERCDQAHFEFLNSFSFPSEFGGKKDQIMGISSLSFDAHDGVLYGASDDSGYCSYTKYLTLSCPDTYARMFSIRIRTTQDEHHKQSVQGELNIINPIYFLDSAGGRITYGKIDVEGMTSTPEGNFLLISEQDISAPVYFPPMLFEYSRDGKLLKEYKLPKKFFSSWGRKNVTGMLTMGATNKWATGCQENKCFEGVSRVPGDDSYVAMTEQSLAQDRKANYLRLIQFNLHSSKNDEVQLLTEHAYEMAPLEDSITAGSIKQSRGVSDILALGKNDYLVIERSYIPYKEKAKDPLSVIRVFRTTCENCTDVKEHHSLDKASSIVIMKKTLVLDMLSVKDEQGQTINNLNIEGMSWGPKLADGSNTIIFSSDNGDNTSNPTRFLVFKTSLQH